MRFEVAYPKKYLGNFEHLRQSFKTQPVFALSNLLNDISLCGNNLSLVSGTDGKLLLGADRLEIRWDKAQETAPYSSALRLKFDVQGYETHLENVPGLNQLFTGEDEKNYGKTDFSLHARVLSSFTKENLLPACLEVEKLVWTDVFGTNAIHGKIDIGSIDPFAGTLSFKSTQEMSSQSHGLFVSYCQKLAKQFQKIGAFAEYPKFENLIVNHWDRVAALIPDHSSRGKMESEMDLSVQMKNENARQDLNYDLKKCVIKMAPHEISIKASKGFRDSKEIPFCEIQVSNYPLLIQNLSCYYNSWQSLLTQTQTLSEAELPPVNSKVVNRIISFCESLSLPLKDRPDDLHIVIQGRNFNDTTIGSLTSAQFTSVVTQLIADITPEMYPQAVQ